MPRRFALALVALLLLLLGALLAGRRLKVPPPAASAVPTLRPTAAIPPTPIPGRRVALYFESPVDDLLHPEARDIPAALDDVAFLRSVAAAVVEGPRRPELVRPFPAGWSLRGAYLLREGIAVVDLSPPPLPEPREAGTPASPRWQAGAHEEDTAIQAIAVTLAKNLPAVTRVVLLVAGEAAETLGGHADLTHPIAPDHRRAAGEAPWEAPASPAAAPTPAAEPSPPASAVPSAAAPPARPVPPRRAPAERT
ncbi:MAG TPA: GerMN domain-containing protein [Thermoanaerobaculia bacterium]|nr:GerMN domain-containing protein [Thermoanaerobaculia bacterium]